MHTGKRKGLGSGKPSDKACKTSGDLSWVHCLGAECVRGDLRIVPGLVLKNVEKEIEIEKGFSRKMWRELLFMLYVRRSLRSVPGPLRLPENWFLLIRHFCQNDS